MSPTLPGTPPPQPYFPQRNSTPTMRHTPSPGPTAARYTHHHPAEKRAGRRIKHLPPSPGGLKGRKESSPGSPPPEFTTEGSIQGIKDEEDNDDRSSASISSFNEDSGNDSTSRSSSDSSTPSLTCSSSRPSTSLNTPSSSAASFSLQQYPEPNDPGYGKHVYSEDPIPHLSVIPSTPIISPPAPNTTSTPASSKSWVAHFGLGKVAKAVVSGSISVVSGPWSSNPSTEKKKKDSSTPHSSKATLSDIIPEEPKLDVRTLTPQEAGEARFVPQARALPIPEELLKGLDEEGIRKKRRDWAEKSHIKLTECARLCSQWPQSGYNLSKWGPNGSKHFYEPQSYGNPEHVMSIMGRQQSLEVWMSENQAFFIPSKKSTLGLDTTNLHLLIPREPHSRHSSATSNGSSDSALPSPTTSTMSKSTEGSYELEGVAAELKVAMGSPLLLSSAGTTSAEGSTLVPPISPRSLKAARSLTELNHLAQSMMLSKTSEMDDQTDKIIRERMDIDIISSSLSRSNGEELLSRSTGGLLPKKSITTRPARAQSCGSKRPIPPLVLERAGQEGEEKRRKVDDAEDEAMVVAEAVQSGVIMPPRPQTFTPKPSNEDISCDPSPNIPSSGLVDNTQTVPNGQGAAVFGHIVKTSDTHPIIISPFFPEELISIISSNVNRGSKGPAGTNVQLGSNIDVPSLLLSFSHPPTTPTGLVSTSTTSLTLPSPPPSTTTRQTPNSSTSSFFRSNSNGSSPYLFDFTRFGSTSSSSINSSPPVVQAQERKLGNLLLSSCPGKRLRMGGPVKGRGPVCRDLKTDLGRIRDEGVGCLVCCLDDAELALLGTPWETYRDVASDLGLDIIRLPMPDGFTFSSLALYDEQITRIASRYTLKGVNVLVHCRGGVGRAGVTACAWAIKMGFVQPHPSLLLLEEQAKQDIRKKTNMPIITPTPNTVQPKSSGLNIPFFSSHNLRSTSTASSSSSSASPTPPVLSASPTTLGEMNNKGGHKGEIEIPAELEHQLIMSIVERVIAMIRSRRGLKAIESFEQVQFLACYVAWLRKGARQGGVAV